MHRSNDETLAEIRKFILYPDDTIEVWWSHMMLRNKRYFNPSYLPSFAQRRLDLITQELNLA